VRVVRKLPFSGECVACAPACRPGAARLVPLGLQASICRSLLLTLLKPYGMYTPAVLPIAM
jgi:hypothetical protein